MEFYLDKIAEILKTHIGLDYTTIGKSSVEKITIQRMVACEIGTVDAYYQHLCNNPAELSELLEFSVIPETWFFRDIRAFEVITQQIKKQLLENDQSTFNILSIPCSTGEEPYSIAMYLIDQGLPSSSFNIDAVDVSFRALEYAKNATYGKNSFRGNSYNGYKEKHFSPDGDYLKLHENITNKVSFNRLNILHSDVTLKGKYDFVLCRNLLIYFDGPTKKIAFEKLSHLLKNTGLLFIGHSEFGSVPRDKFHNLGSDLSFALSKPDNPNYNDTKKQSADTQNRKNKTPATPRTENKKLSFSSYIQAEPSAIRESSTEIGDLLLTAKQMANSAQYNEAEKLCREHISKHGEHQEAYYLLGLIASSKKQTELAESMLRKTLFLNPKHYEALIHLSLLLQEKGDILNAELFKNRANRAIDKG